MRTEPASGASRARWPLATSSRRDRCGLFALGRRSTRPRLSSVSRQLQAELRAELGEPEAPSKRSARGWRGAPLRHEAVPASRGERCGGRASGEAASAVVGMGEDAELGHAARPTAPAAGGHHSRGMANDEDRTVRGVEPALALLRLGRRGAKRADRRCVRLLDLGARQQHRAIAEVTEQRRRPERCGRRSEALCEHGRVGDGRGLDIRQGCLEEWTTEDVSAEPDRQGIAVGRADRHGAGQGNDADPARRAQRRRRGHHDLKRPQAVHPGKRGPAG